MRSLDLPQILYQPFAATGDKNTILNSPSTEDPQRANLQTGFPPITQIPIANGGIPPERMDFNGLGYLLSSFYFFTQCGGIYTFNRNVSNAIGGYPLGAVLYYTDSNGTTYKVRSLLENNTFDFVTTPSYIDDKHWAYVSSTPITQDTSASSTGNVFSTAAVQSLLNTVVHKTGDETISGSKTFTSNVVINGSLAALDLKNTDLTKGTTPTTASPYCGVNFKDKNGNVLGDLLYFYNKGSSAKETGVALRAFKANAASDSGNAELAILYPASDNPYTRAPASDRNGSIVTTTGINKSPNGYVKLGNGLIIQWGTSWGGYVSFPVPFQSADSYQIGSTWLNQSKYCDGVQLTRRDAAGFSFAGRNLSWVAIGY